MAGEMLGPILLSIHNLTYYQRLMSAARAAIRENRYAEFHEQTVRLLSTATADSFNRDPQGSA
jgi:queuine tRNA-ribosyltransferase